MAVSDLWRQNGDTAGSAVALPVERVSREIHRRIVNGSYGPGEQLPTERELQLEFGCSRLTVAKAMAPLVATGLIRRHRGRGTFVQPGVRSHRRKRTTAHRSRSVTFISPGRSDEAVVIRRGVLESLHGVLTEAGLSLNVEFFNNDAGQFVRCLTKTDRQDSAGLVLWPDPSAQMENALRDRAQSKIPLVLVDNYLPNLDCDYVVTDNVAGAVRMVEHLVKLGHRRLGYLTIKPRHTSLRDRLTGFLRGLVEYELPTDAHNVMSVERVAMTQDRVDRDELSKALDTLLAGSQHPTALLVSNDWLAMSVYYELRGRGLRVPDDISLMGYDDIDAAAHFAVPLTTVRQEYFEMGRIAGQILVERISNRPATIYYHKTITPQLCVRDSTAPPATN